MFLSVCKKENKKDALKDPEKIPDESIKSNLPEDPKNPRTNIREDKGFSTPRKTPDGKDPEITVDVSKVIGTNVIPNIAFELI